MNSHSKRQAGRTGPWLQALMALILGALLLAAGPARAATETITYIHGDISARGGYGPDLLPGTSGVFTNAKMKAIVCKDCGLVRFYAQRDTLAKLSSDKGWQRLM